MSRMTIIDAIEHEHLFAPLFRDSSWGPWKTALRAMFGLEMSEAEIELFKQCTGRTTPPDKQFKETWLICGRRGGKSFMMALCATFLATFFNYKPFLNIGERATVMVIAADRKQARVIMRYTRGAD